MRIAFYVIGNARRSGPLTGDNIRYNGSSASGTDTSAILVAEQLALYGHEVVYACENTNVGEVNRGVQYTNLNFESIHNKEFDILVSMLWVENYDELPIKVTKALIYWCHMQWVYGIDAIREYVKRNNLSFGAIHISDWEKNHTSEIFSSIETKNFLEETIPNPLPMDVVNEVNSLDINKRKEKFTFHATPARGARLAYDTIKELDWKNSELHLFDYLMSINLNWGRKDGHEVEIDSNLVHIHDGSDKHDIFVHLKESEYFIYAPFTPYENVHKDTFSCVVAEALAMGCVVVTYPIGALPDTFPDCCAWLDLPEGLDIVDIQNETLTQDPERKFDRIDNIVKKIRELENSPDLKNVLVENGRRLVVEKYNIGDVGYLWQSVIKKLAKE